MNISKVFIIILEENIENKKSSINAQLKKLPLHRDTTIEFFSAIDGRLLNNQDTHENECFQCYPYWKIDTDNVWWNREMTNGEIGCSLSHWKIWNKAYKECLEKILILEEDFIICGKHFDVLKTKIDWDLFYLGRSQLKQDHPIDEQLVRPGFSYCTHAYMLTQKALKALLGSGFDKNLIPIDELLPTTYTTHPREDIKKLFNVKLNAVALVNDLIKQRDSKTSTTLNFSKRNELTSFEHYKPVSKKLYECYGESTESWLKKYINPQIQTAQYELICDEPIPNIYEFPLFTPLFCQELIEEAESFGYWTTSRHEHYPTTDILLNSIGLRLPVDFILYSFIAPIISNLFKMYCDPRSMKTQNFIAKYTPEAQQHLSLHNDGADFTVVTHLNCDFYGGGTFFPKFKQLVLPKYSGMATLHLGRFGYYHGARPVTSGKRYVLVSFITLSKAT